MKTHITISIDVDLAEKLKHEKSQSALINSYLRSFFKEEIPKEIEKTPEEDFKNLGI